MRTHVKALALGGMLAVALTGCMKLDMNLELQSDDTIDGTMVVAVSRELAELSGTDPEELSEQLREEALSGDDMPEGSTVEPYEDEDFIGSEVTFDGAPLDAFGGEDQTLSIRRDGDEFVVAGSMDLSTASTEGLDLTQGVDVKIAISFPGAVAEHDGELDGTTVTWIAEPGEVTPINARGAAEAGALGALAGSLLYVVIGAVVLVVVLVVVLLVVRSRRRSAAPTGPTTALPAEGAPVGAPYQPGGSPQTFQPGGPAPTTQPAPGAPAAPPAPPTTPPAPGGGQDQPSA